MMWNMVKVGTKALLLGLGVLFISYMVSTPGEQLIAAFVGGCCISGYAAWQHYDTT
jgi:hypothetical protein